MGASLLRHGGSARHPPAASPRRGRPPQTTCCTSTRSPPTGLRSKSFAHTGCGVPGWVVGGGVGGVGWEAGVGQSRQTENRHGDTSTSTDGRSSSQQVTVHCPHKHALYTSDSTSMPTVAAVCVWGGGSSGARAAASPNSWIRRHSRLGDGARVEQVRDDVTRHCAGNAHHNRSTLTYRAQAKQQQQQQEQRQQQRHERTDATAQE
jgi:hypothetical protein